ncbi:MAG: RNA polymerase sigma factor [Clostridia bacterium]|nr:RNA polymerase sigma factor [Clostridia bacterium]
MLYTQLKDEDLVMLTLAGEQNAYEALVARYEARVISAAESVTHSRYMAEDAAQDTFVTAWMKLNMLREPSKYGAWVCRIARNCAKNTISRFKSYISLDMLEETLSDDMRYGDPEMAFISSEEKRILQDSVSELPSKVREIITLHYYNGLSVSDIASRLGISEGTVKWQLHDGRKRIRKELSAMNEQIDDTLVQRVMKKVKELKLWKLKNSKKGFETEYKDVLAEVEELPESANKSHALADVLMMGWWWLPGEKNDALFERISKLAEEGKNEDVMAFVVARQDRKCYGENVRREFVREVQIPRLEKGGFKKALAQELHWLGSSYYRNGEEEKGGECFKKALDVLTPSDLYYAYTLATQKARQSVTEKYKDVNSRRYVVTASGDELRNVNGEIRYWDGNWHKDGYLYSASRFADMIFRNASYCDGYFTAKGLKKGEFITASDGTTLTFGGDNITVSTPCGVFDNCSLWVACHENTTYNTYYKGGIGIVKQEKKDTLVTETRTLKNYRIFGGKGILPFAAGNMWEYDAGYDSEIMSHSCVYTVCHADKDNIIIAGNNETLRHKYDENSWLDMIQQIRSEYWYEDKEGTQTIQDVSHAVKRAEILAKTPLEKAHTKASCAVARRIMETDPGFNPNHTAVGHWNFFERNVIHVSDKKAVMTDDFRWSFEWKRDPSEALMCNDIYGIFHDAVECLWSDKFAAGASFEHTHLLWSEIPIKTLVSCEAVEEITVKAGTFKDCLKISLDISEYPAGLEYRGGKKEYFFAKGIGIIKTVNYFYKGALCTEYQLASYVGEGEGYMPFVEGAVRSYVGVNLTDGDVCGENCYFEKDENGDTVLFEDRIGVRKRNEPISDYSSIHGETIEDELWEAGKHDESRLRHDINNFHLLCHFLGRPGRYWNAVEKAVAWNKYRLRIMEGLNGDGTVPDAWLGLYAATQLRTGCALCGLGKAEEGRPYLEKSLQSFIKWEAIEKDAPMEVGDPLIYGGIKVIKGKDLLLLPNGEYDRISRDYPYLFRDRIGLLVHAVTSPHGWEWFDGVRSDAWFMDFTQRVKKASNV